MTSERLVGGPRPHRGILSIAFLTLLLAAGLLGSAAGNLVHVVDTLDTVYAERRAVPAHFVVATTITELAAANVSALGTRDQPVVLQPALGLPLLGTATAGLAGTALRKDNWTYAVVLKESVPNRAPAGNYSVSLAVNGVDRGAVYLVKQRFFPGLASPLDGSLLVPAQDQSVVPVGARVAFDLGTEPPTNVLFYLRVAYLDLPHYTLKSAYNASNGRYYWIGVGGDIDGVVNPVLPGQVGEGMRITIVQGDGMAPHNLDIVDSAGNVVAGPTPDITNLGDEATLEWTPEDPGDFVYECVYHVPFQEGIVHVTG